MRSLPVLPVALALLLALPAAARERVTPELLAALDAAAPGQRVPACLVMADQLDADRLAQGAVGLQRRALRASVAQQLQQHAATSQRQVRAALDVAVAQGRAAGVFELWLGNALYFEGERDVVLALAALPGVDRVLLRARPDPSEVQDAAPAGAGSYPFADDFESGTLQPHWTLATTGSGTAFVSASDGPVDQFHLVMETTTDGVDSIVSVTVSLDLTGQTGVGIRFQHKEFSDEDHAEDGVFVSDDGVTWVQALSLIGGQGTYTTRHVELDAVAAANTLAYGPGFQVRWQWRDNFGLPTDGFAFDDIEIAPGIGTAPPPSPEPNLVALQAPELWDLGHDGAGVLVGSIDSGTWITHPDLANRIWLNPDEVAGNALDDDANGFVDDLHGWDFLSGTADVTSADPHGTNTAGIVCGDGSGGIKLTGMAPGATLLTCEVLSESEYWAAQQYCLAAGVDVITSSYSYKWAAVPKPDYHMHRQLAQVELAAGVIHANSIGNQGGLLPTYPIPFNIATPGNCPAPFAHPALADGGRGSVMGCGGIELPFDTLYASSGRGPAAWEDLLLYSAGYPWTQDPAYWDYPYGGFSGGLPGLIKPDVVAYTTNIQTTTTGTGYAAFGGTSAATPHLGGAMALLIDAQPEAQPRHVAAALELTAQDLGTPGKDSLYGSGKIQVQDAARRLVVLGRLDDTTPAVGGSFAIDLFGPPDTPIAWVASLALLDDGSDFNLGLPFFLMFVVNPGPTGHVTLPLAIPNDPIFSGLTVWSQFTAKGGAPQWGSARFWSVPEGLTIE